MAVPNGSYYLQLHELEQVPLTFDPLEQTKGCFFDLTNLQMFCVQQGFTDVKVKSLKTGDNCRVTRVREEHQVLRRHAARTVHSDAQHVRRVREHVRGGRRRALSAAETE